MKTKHIGALLLLAAAAWCGCGVPGAPRPPSLDLPRPVEDLKAARKGDKVSLVWTPPRETTDGARIKHMGITRICRAVGSAPMTTCAQVVGELRPEQVPASMKAGFQDTLPRELQEQNPEGFVTYAVETLNARGRSAGLSDLVQVPLVPTLAPPQRINVEVAEDGVHLSWTPPGGVDQASVRHFARVYRRTKGTNAATVAGEVPAGASEFFDRNFEWEQTYEYWVTYVSVIDRVTNPVTVEGDDSPVTQVFVHDIFPPAVPTGLEAVYTPGAPGFIDLTWAPNSERDLAGYNVYRHEEGAAPVKINGDLVKAPAFRDTNVQPGHKYFYAVSAVDLRGNESGKSAEASEGVP